MKGSRFIFNLVAVAALTLTASIAHAQAPRTWISGVGDDNNPCSRTAPCKTLSGTLSKTADGGEIDVIDPAPIGAATINKNITVDGGAAFAGILASSVNGIVVNDSATANPNSIVVTLRNLAINGAGSGFFGVKIVSARSVTVENCQIFKFRGTTGNIPGRAISDERTAAGSKLTVINTTMNDNLGNGVVILPTAAGATSGVSAIFDNVRSFDNGASGAFFGGGSKVAIKNSFFTGNVSNGIQSADANTEVNLADTFIAHNGTGVFAGGGASVTRATRSTIVENGTGVTISGGTFESYGDNNIRGNNAGNVGGTQVGQL